MADSKSNRKKKIEGLIAERKKFEAWLAQLDGRRTNAAEHVYERVLTDYTKRLEIVRGELAGEADGLQEMVSGLESRLGDEERAVKEKSDERAEAELRAMVGEFTDAQWEGARRELDDALSALRETFDGTERELAQLKELLGTVHAPAPPRPSMMRQAVASVDDDLADARRDEAAATADAPRIKVRTTPPAPSRASGEAPRSPTPPAPAEKPARKATPAVEHAPAAAAAASASPPPDSDPATEAFDELAFLRSVAAPPTSPRGTATVGAKQPEPPAQGELAGQPAPSRPRASGRVAAEPEVQEPPPAPPAPLPPPPPPPPPPRQPSGAATTRASLSASPLGPPTARTSQSARTLKCQECGTLNFPTEWYCERCGGELAAF